MVTRIDWRLWRTAVSDPLFWLMIVYIVVAIVCVVKSFTPGLAYLAIAGAVAGCGAFVFGAMFYQGTPMIVVGRLEDIEALDAESMMDDADVTQ